MPVRAAKVTLVAAGLAVVGFLALRTSPYLQYIRWMPRSLGEWADHHGVLRNTVAFFALGLAALLVVRAQRWLVLMLCLFATLLEVAQLWIPGRVFDLRDIAASLAGVLLAWPLAWLVRRPRPAA